jgi:hypothetical protein
MAGAPWFPESHNHARFDPLWQGHWDPSGLIEDGGVSQFFRRHYARGSAPGIAQWKLVRPRGRGQADVEVPGCGGGRTVRVPVNAGASFAPGQMVTVANTRQGAVVLSQPVSGLIGSSAFALDVLEGGAYAELKFVRCTPSSIDAGLTDVELTVMGQGILAAPLPVVMAGVYVGDETDPDFNEYEADPYVTLHDVTYVSPYSFTVLADSSADTPDGYYFTIVGRPG